VVCGREASWTLGSRPGSVITGHDQEVRGATHNWPPVFRVRGAWPVGMSLSHRAPATPVAGQAQCALIKVARCTVRLASGLDARCVKKQCGLVGLCIGGRMTFNLRLSRARMGVVAMRQDSSY
jgi:hypothetical protein